LSCIVFGVCPGLGMTSTALYAPLFFSYLMCCSILMCACRSFSECVLSLTWHKDMHYFPPCLPEAVI